MITVTLQEAKAKLNQLIELARSGEEVVLFRGSKVVARLEPLSEGDLEIAHRLNDSQAEHFWKEVKSDPSKPFPDAVAAIKHLKKKRRA